MTIRFTHPNFTGSLLIATPGMRDAQFQGALVLICAHSADGAMGLIINRLAPSPRVAGGRASDSDVVDMLARRTRLFVGGPSESSRPFVLHSRDWFDRSSTLVIDGGHALTASPKALMQIAEGRAVPAQSMVALGYAGWGPRELEREVNSNAWLTAPGDPAITFCRSPEAKYRLSLRATGAGSGILSSEVGHA